MQGLPAATEAELIATQSVLIDIIHQSSKLDREAFAKYVLPSIRSYARFVHLLPASQDHHHRGAGGLLRHGLEVAQRAAGFAYSTCFVPPDVLPKDRKPLETRWRVSCLLAGLCHDLGKPIADLDVVDKDGVHAWDPFDPGTPYLIDFLNRNRIENYFLRWRKGRFRHHEDTSSIIFPRIVGNDTLQWLGELDPEIRFQLVQSVSRGTSAPHTNRFREIVAKSDRGSVIADMKHSFSSTPSGTVGFGSQRHIIDAMRNLFSTGAWKVNTLGGRVFVTNEGTFISWPGNAGGADVARFIRENQIPGVTQDPDGIANDLIDIDVAEPFVVGDNRLRYWRVSFSVPAPDGAIANITLFCLKLKDPSYLIETYVPPIAGTVQHIQMQPGQPGADMVIESYEVPDYDDDEPEVDPHSDAEGSPGGSVNQPPRAGAERGHPPVVTPPSAPPQASPQPPSSQGGAPPDPGRASQSQSASRFQDGPPRAPLQTRGTSQPLQARRDAPQSPGVGPSLSHTDPRFAPPAAGSDGDAQTMRRRGGDAPSSSTREPHPVAPDRAHSSGSPLSRVDAAAGSPAETSERRARSPRERGADPSPPSRSAHPRAGADAHQASESHSQLRPQNDLVSLLRSAFPSAASSPSPEDRAFFASRGSAAAPFLQIAEYLRAQTRPPAWIVVATDGIRIAYPDAFQSVGVEPAPKVADLAATGLFSADPKRPGSVLRIQEDSTRWLHLQRDPSRHLASVILFGGTPVRTRSEPAPRAGSPLAASFADAETPATRGDEASAGHKRNRRGASAPPDAPDPGPQAQRAPGPRFGPHNATHHSSASSLQYVSALREAVSSGHFSDKEVYFQGDYVFLHPDAVRHFADAQGIPEARMRDILRLSDCVSATFRSHTAPGVRFPRYP